MDIYSMIKKLERPAGKVDAVLDTDAYNEVDDQFAIAYMLRCTDRINVRAFFAAPYLNARSKSPCDGMEKSYNEIFHMLELTDRIDMNDKVFRGSKNYLTDENTPVDSPAAHRLCELADEYTAENPLYVVAIGAITNIASAILIKPEIIEKIVVVWLGGHSLEWHDINEFNMAQDIAAARIIFGCGVPFIQLPCMGVVSAFTVSEADLNMWFRGKNKLCDYLIDNTVEYLNRSDGKPWSKAIWDVTAVAWLADGNFFESRLIPSPIPEYDCRYAFDSRRHFMRYVYSINRDELLNDLLKKLTE